MQVCTLCLNLFISLKVLYYVIVNGGYSDWTAWDTCSVTCGNGTQTRTRDCSNPVPEHGGIDCTGDTSETQTCDQVPCPGKCNREFRR